MSGLGFGALLLAIWLLLWGELSPANVASGLVVVAAVMVAVPDARFHIGRPYVRPRWALRLAWRIVGDVVRANVEVTREIVARQSSITTGIVAVDLPGCSDGLLTFVANVLALTPGTMAIEVDRSPGVVYVHVLHLDDVESIRRDVRSLAALAVMAFGSPDAVAILRLETSR